MFSVVKSVEDFHQFINKYEDPRTGQWFLASSPFYPVAACLTYIFIVKFLGPRFMEKRKPFELKRILIAYNLFQVIFNGWLFYEFAVSGWMTKEWSYRCQSIDYSFNPKAYRLAVASYYFYVIKYVDLLDTIFFILRKKTSQITTLHLTHHTIVIISVWVGAKFSPGGHGTFCCFLNSFVHVVMYGYYLLAAQGPKVQKYLWWKKYITRIQMIQFAAVVIHGSQLYFLDCNYPRINMSIVIFNCVLYFILFSYFYKKTYKHEEEKSTSSPDNLSQQRCKNYNKFKSR